MSEKFTVYFHDDFDGILTAALLFNFLSWKGADVADFFPMTYTPTLKTNWHNHEFQRPFFLVDFLYHPDADWWFDHHETTFIYHEWKEAFKDDLQHKFDPGAKSCFGLVLNFLKSKHNFIPPEQFQKLENLADIVDSAGFKNPADAVSFDTPEQTIYLLLDNLDRVKIRTRKDIRQRLIRSLAFGNVEQMLEVDFKNEIKYLKERVKKSFDLYKKYVVTEEKVNFLDSSKMDVAYGDFIGYYLNPNIKYSVSIRKDTVSYHISVGRNPWIQKDGKVNIGDLMGKYNGGGHNGVGGTETDTHSEALKICREIVEYLNANG